MSEQVVDLRSAWAILRRRRRAFFVAIVLGGLLGAGVAVLRPAMFGSTSIVLLPPTPSDSTGQTTTHDIKTQVQIAGSTAVLGSAGASVKPRLTAKEVDERVDIEAPTVDVLRITAQGETPRQAEALAAAVAKAHVSYLDKAANALSEDQQSVLSDRRKTLNQSLKAVNAEIKSTSNRLDREDKSSAAGRADAAALANLTAQRARLVLDLDDIKKEVSAGAQAGSGSVNGRASVIQQASPAQRTGLVQHFGMDAALGAAVLAVLFAVYVMLTGRRDRTLRSRDDIADAIGVPVVASLASHPARSAVAWSRVLETYSPDNQDAWSLRQLLRLITPGPPGGGVRPTTADTALRAVIVLCLSEDVRALAVGPQLASYTASTGVAVELVAAQSHASAGPLWAACSKFPEHAEARPGLAVSCRQDVPHDADLIVHLAVVDRRHPELYLYGADDAMTILAVSSGSATTSDLTALAVAVDDVGHPVDGIVVVDPDPSDRTSGRLLTDRAHHVPLPTLMTGTTAGAEARAHPPRRPR